MEHYAAVVELWQQCSECSAVQKTEVIELDPNTTIADLMAHISTKWDLWGKGDVRIVKSSQCVQSATQRPM